MSATYLYLFLLLGTLVSAYIIISRQKRVQKQIEERVHSLERDLITANESLGRNVESLKNIRGNSLFENYSGRIISQIDQAVVCIDQHGIIQLINSYAEQYMDLAAATGKPYREVMHIHRSGEADDFSMIEAGFVGKVQILPENFEIASPHGTFPIKGTILPLMTGRTVDAVAFIFSDMSVQNERVQEEQAFFSAAAHELRTPLTVIRMTVSLLRERMETMPREKIMEHLKRTDETTERLVKLVNDFLNISRIDQGRVEIKKESFDMVTLTDEVIHDLSLLAKERQLFINHEDGTEHRMVLADRAKTTEVLSNLISNGLKYTIQGGLTISHKNYDSVLATKITDTGTGIPVEYQRLLFKRFGQVGKGSQQTPGKSTGLGLYISKKFAQLMRGDVILEKSEPGAGSTFTFTLPLNS